MDNVTKGSMPDPAHSCKIIVIVVFFILLTVVPSIRSNFTAHLKEQLNYGRSDPHAPSERHHD
jgi:hypothetical protein